MSKDKVSMDSLFGTEGDDSHSGDIDSHEQLQTYYGEPMEIGLRMHADHLPETYQKFVRRSPFVILGTADRDGMPSTSPKGDAPGFVQVLDDKTLLLPDRPGNNQVDALHNILDNPNVSLIFMIPGVRETLRVQGRAAPSTDRALRQRLEANGKLPRSVIRIDVTKSYLHCGKALIRSKLWDPSTHAERGEVPSLAKMTMALEHNQDLPGTTEDWEENAERAYRDTLY